MKRQGYVFKKQPTPRVHGKYAEYETAEGVYHYLVPARASHVNAVMA